MQWRTKKVVVGAINTRPLTEGRRTCQVHKDAEPPPPLRRPLTQRLGVLGRLNLAMALAKRIEGLAPPKYKCCPQLATGAWLLLLSGVGQAV